MKVTECIYEFEKLVEIISPGFKAKQGLDTDTILLALNIAQERFIYNNYLNKPTVSENIVTIHNKQDDLRNLIVQGELFTPIPISSGILTGIGYNIDTPISNYTFLYYLRSDSLISRTAPNVVNSQWVGNLLIEDYNEINKCITTPYNKLFLRQPVISVNKDGLTLIVDSYTTGLTVSDSFSLDYLRWPKYLGVSNTSTTNTEYELAGYLHEEIVRFAVDIFLKEYKFLLIQKESK